MSSCEFDDELEEMYGTTEGSSTVQVEEISSSDTSAKINASELKNEEDNNKSDDNNQTKSVKTD